MQEHSSGGTDGPLQLDESARRNYWFDSGGLGRMALNAPLKGRISAEIVIIGGGFTGLAAAYNLICDHPEKKIVLLESTCCGGGASGRNGGFADAGIRGLWKICDEDGPETARGIYDITLDGVNAIRRFVDKHGVDCDFAANGSMELAAEYSQIKWLEEEKEHYDKLGLKAELLGKSELQKIIKSDRYISGIRYPYGATLNPFKLVRGMKRVVEEKGVEVYERTPVVHVQMGRHIKVETNMGHVRSPAVVLATNGYSPVLGFFKNRIIPMCAYVVATEPLTDAQRGSIGWLDKEKLSDMNTIFDYFHLSFDNRIIFGGAGLQYLCGGRLCTRIHWPAIEKLQRSLLRSFPQLEGIRITHRWGGTLGMSLDFLPSVGVLGEDNNIFYAVGYSGEGTVLSQVAGKIIAELYSQKSNALTRLFFVNKGIPYSFPDPFRYLGIKAYTAYLQRFGSRSLR